MSNLSKKIDSFMLLLFIDLFCLISWLYLGKRTILDFFMLGILFSLAIITYFTGLITGLIGSAFTLFLYASYILYSNLVLGKNVEASSYMWMVFIPITTVVLGNLNINISSIQEQNNKLQKEYKKLVKIDETTGLDNIRSFYDDLNREMSRSKRHKMPLTLMIIRIEYINDIYEILGESRMKELFKLISNAISEATRSEDRRFSISKDMFSILMPNTDIKGAQVVKNRIKNSIDDINLNVKEMGKNINLDVKLGVVQYNINIKDSFEFKSLAEKELEYDV